MSLVVDSNPASPTMNSFTSRAFADAYFEGQLFADAWTNADPPDKDKALVTATRLIVDAVAADAWIGWPASYSQPLPFPRNGMITRTGASLPSGFLPVELQEATAEYARQLLALGKMPDTPSDTAGIKSLTAGPISVTFDESYKTPTDLPISIWNRIAWLVFGAASKMFVPVTRT